MLAAVACVALSTWAGVRTNDYSWVRGVNYSFPVPREQLVRELGYGRRVNLNAIRFWLDYWSWKREGAAYVAKVAEQVKTARECGYYSMPIIFNGNLASPRLFAREELADQERYVRELTKACVKTQGILMWDVMNEPDCANHFIDEVTGSEREQRCQAMWAWLRAKCRLVRSCDPSSYVTVGHTWTRSMEETAAECDIFSFHNYLGTRKAVAEDFDRALAIGRKHGKCVLQTETGCYARANPYDMVLEACEQRRLGWFVFNLMVNTGCARFHGIFYADGTVRDPAAIAAMMGCYRNRDADTIIVPYPNREHQAERAIRMIRDAMKDRRANGFARDQLDALAILDACEYGANLLEAAELVPMAVPPTAKINAWRKREQPPIDEIRPFAFELAEQLRRQCCIVGMER